jgi:radical SAM protein (TIGR01212 family)
MEKYIFTFNRYLKEKFGERVHKLSLNAGFGCPNKDGTLSTLGCMFCNEKGFTFYKDTDLSLDEQIKQSIEFAQQRFKAEKFIAYFQEGTNTSKDTTTLKQTFDVIKKYKNIVGLFIGTRPDYIDEEKIALIHSYSSSHLVCIELGMQTASNKSLEFLGRNHSFSDVAHAVELIKKYPEILTAAHVILGIPGETKQDHDHTISQLKTLEFDFIKFHVFHILKNTHAHTLHKNNTFSLLNREEYINLLIYFLERIKKETVIMRLISTADQDVLIEPHWINDRNAFLSELERVLKENNSFQGRLYTT